MRRIAFHPFLFSAYFVLALVGHNVDQVRLSVALRALVVALLGAGLVLVALQTLLRNWYKASLVSTLALVLFFTYGHVYGYLETLNLGGFMPGRHRLLLPLWVVIFSLGAWLITRRLGDAPEVSAALNLIALVALIFPIFQIAGFQIRLLAAKRLDTQSGYANQSLTSDGAMPDVYLIILDEYTREDVLTQVFNYENAPFLGELDELGFSVISCSQSNYAQTELVLGSLLNMDYVQALGTFDPQDSDRVALFSLIMDSVVERFLRDLGYTLVAFETGFYFSEFMDADVYLAPSDITRLGLFGGMNSFEVMLLKSSAGLLLSDTMAILPFFDTHHPLEIKRQQVLYDLEMLAKLPEVVPGPKFVFAHILMPHPPFVFNAEGEPVTYAETLDTVTYQGAFREQVEFLNRRLIPVLRQIIENSSTSPVIILQGDTGPGWVSDAQRMAILNALYLPGGEERLYPKMTPVNTFRVIFDQYFGGQFDLIEDISYFSRYDAPFDFELIPHADICGD